MSDPGIPERCISDEVLVDIRDGNKGAYRHEVLEMADRVLAAEAKVAEQAATIERLTRIVCPLCREGIAVAEFPGGWFHDSDDPRSERISSFPFQCIATPPKQAQPCPDCEACARHAYSDATTPGFFHDKCERHRKQAKP